MFDGVPRYQQRYVVCGCRSQPSGSHNTTEWCAHAVGAAWTLDVLLQHVVKAQDSVCTEFVTTRYADGAAVDSGWFRACRSLTGSML